MANSSGSGFIAGLIGGTVGFLFGYLIGKPKIAAAATVPATLPPVTTTDTVQQSIKTAVTAAKAAGYKLFDNKLGGQSSLDIFAPTIPSGGKYTYQYIDMGPALSSIVELQLDTGVPNQTRQWLLV